MNDMSGSTGVAIGGMLLFFVAAVIGIACFVFWVWMLIHAIKNKRLSDTEKIIWVLVILFLHVLGALIYFFVGRPKGGG